MFLNFQGISVLNSQILKLVWLPGILKKNYKKNCTILILQYCWPTVTNIHKTSKLFHTRLHLSFRPENIYRSAYLKHKELNSLSCTIGFVLDFLIYLEIRSVRYGLHQWKVTVVWSSNSPLPRSWRDRLCSWWAWGVEVGAWAPDQSIVASGTRWVRHDRS